MEQNSSLTIPALNALNNLNVMPELLSEVRYICREIDYSESRLYSVFPVVLTLSID